MIWLCTVIVPPISSVKRFVMDKPSPLPPNLRVMEASLWVKGLNRPSVLFSGMPMPVSSISIIRFRAVKIRQRTCPFSVNFMALLTRFIMICLMRVGSPCQVPQQSPSNSQSSKMPFSLAFTEKMRNKLDTTSSRSNSMCSSLSSLASIFEKSSTSLTKSSSVFAAV